MLVRSELFAVSKFARPDWNFLVSDYDKAVIRLLRPLKNRAFICFLNARLDSSFVAAVKISVNRVTNDCSHSTRENWDDEPSAKSNRHERVSVPGFLL